ncbi:GlxA family transcriptional regulator [Pseudonocardia sp. WMMC193]|uniref:GlxA family transcriptional regulator n=1 Tax=Pseudonocardia sp. WMMC193 TaxID=2911965 RepID=UPI001F3DA233|nr:GlxA family transcriptional regulator [Pseudonocardia sp. WMMC193]MCF7551256.1 GlxA family transcriptional regulator [Pseudonocardia sp. WMMC193]
MPPRTVAVLAFDDAQVLDVVGPAEVFYAADALAGGGQYTVQVTSPDGTDVRGGSGLRIGVAAALSQVAGPLDTVVVPGSHAFRRVAADPVVLAALDEGVGRSRRVASVCAGAFLLGSLGVLDGRRATTHWMFLDELAADFPAATVERGPIFVADGPIHTSAGVTAGIDLALALVEADLGPEVAREVARYLVVFMQRPGGQAQFSVRLEARATRSPTIRAVLDAVAADPAGDHRLAALSARAGFSERHLVRVFARETGTTPARYVEQVRVEAARQLLESTELPLAAIARRSGLGSPDALRRAFLRELGIGPHDYRLRFGTTGVRVS